jgi:hypothetical protein
MTERDRLLIDFHLQALALLGWAPPAVEGDALDDLRNGDLLTTTQAAKITDVSDQTIINWAEHAASIGRPIGARLSTWIISKPRLLAYIEEHRGGLHERVKAERRFDELWPKWSQAQELRVEAKARAVS